MPYIFSIMCLVAALTMGYTQLVNTQRQVHIKLVDRQLSQTMQQLAQRLKQYYAYWGTYPAGLAELNDPLWAPIAAPIGTLNYYSTSTNPDAWPNDGVYSYQRTVVYSPQEFEFADEEAFLQSNSCGNHAEFDSADYWCPAASAMAFSQTERQVIEQRQWRAYQQLAGLEAVFLKYYATMRHFPRGVLLPGEAANLNSLVSGQTDPTTPTECTGAYSFDGMLLDCSALFAINTGQPVYYIYNNPENITLQIPTGVFDAASQPQMKIAEVTLGLLQGL